MPDVTRKDFVGCLMVSGDTERSSPPKYRDKLTARFANGEGVSRFQAFAKQAYECL